MSINRIAYGLLSFDQLLIAFWNGFLIRFWNSNQRSNLKIIFKLLQRLRLSLRLTFYPSNYWCLKQFFQIPNHTQCLYIHNQLEFRWDLISKINYLKIQFYLQILLYIQERSSKSFLVIGNFLSQNSNEFYLLNFQTILISQRIHLLLIIESQYREDSRDHPLDQLHQPRCYPILEYLQSFNEFQDNFELVLYQYDYQKLVRSRFFQLSKHVNKLAKLRFICKKFAECINCNASIQNNLKQYCFQNYQDNTIIRKIVLQKLKPEFDTGSSFIENLIPILIQKNPMIKQLEKTILEITIIWFGKYSHPDYTR
ncbi:unnamed protein product [Paramecium octaurelia]|uniref:Uncharacterized protein n=1 Tax=Paramecium octaurelia TaxID=43137 RepID=A0A8S1TBC1_PAROT|nr:unnamed protein product [Paramecium octaurelia]